ncbi:glycosyltransferase family 4 protein [Selenihalanaerobacter shriftii]|uniref:Glycosyltransferase involved in cell wall bisynthesis n=1 Tax=Selenihalanaerobacter shriftii TaxID=142842 RepID=A0A1T4R0Y8_9FIRM|nr:glycosyltransferase family 4 protein [Selenihalanaerobacter shriftii]SKA09516.1 Glycosyltransferase involved in cell wall bisynthesis [Selenihalanaerobacter shriftii]
MDILCLFITYPNKPDNHTMFKNLTKRLSDKGHNVNVVTIQERKYGESTKLNNENGVNVLRVKTGNFFDTNLIEKGLTMLSLGHLFKRAVKKYFSEIDFDLIIHSCPPITYNPLIKYIKKKYNSKSYLILRDIFPDNAKDLGVIDNIFIYKFFKRMERNLYKYSDYIGCMSQGNIKYVLEHNPEVDEKKMHILRNWSNYKEKLSVDQNSIRKDYGYTKDDFIAVFGGNMGKAQGLDFILNIAKKIESKRIKFLLIGRGTQKERLKKRAIDGILKILDYVPKEQYEKLVTACDVGIVSLVNKYSIPNIPSKTVDFFKLGLPIIACIDESTDYGHILENEAKAGLFSIHGEEIDFINNLMEVANNENLRNKMSINARQYYEEYLTTEKATKTILKEIK